MAREAGIELEKSAPYEEGRSEALRTLTSIRAQTGGPNIYDTILVDEAQDHSAEEMRALRATHP